MPLPFEKPHQAPQTVIERDRWREAEAIAHGGVDGMKLNVLLGLTLMLDGHLDAQRARHRLDHTVDAHRRARRKVDRESRARGLYQPQDAVDRVVRVHEVDEVPTVAAERELALTRGQCEQPAGRNLPRGF